MITALFLVKSLKESVTLQLSSDSWISASLHLFMPVRIERQHLLLFVMITKLYRKKERYHAYLAAGVKQMSETNLTNNAHTSQIIHPCVGQTGVTRLDVSCQTVPELKVNVT